MTRDEAIQQIRHSIKATDYLTASKGGLYECPFCGSGTRAHGTGAMKYYPETNTCYCHACKNEAIGGKRADVIDLYRQAAGVDFNTALQQLTQQLNITIDSHSPAEGRRDDLEPRKHTDAAPAAKNPQKAPQPPQSAAPDFTEYFALCVRRLTDPAAASYLSERGISVETAAAHWIGFDPQADPAKAPGAMDDEYKPHPVPRMIVPAGPSFYMGRRIDGKEDFAKINSGKTIPCGFNETALYKQDVQEVFITEGAFDALSFLEAGAEAIALNSSSNSNAFIDRMEIKRPAASCTLILCLDNDDAGRRAAQTLRAGLQRLNISFVDACKDICGQYKDPNERLQHDRKGFFDAVKQARRMLARPDNVQDYIAGFMAAEIEAFKSDIKTGYENLDDAAGGLYSGLYCVAAISSLGKTTFAHQMADQIAAAGNDVVFFSLEQSRLELVTKSIARITAQDNMETAVGSLSIRKGYLPQRVLNAANKYAATVQDRVSIVEGNFNCNIAFIGDYVRRYIQRTGKRPVVFIDYLQILQPDPAMNPSGRQSTKDVIDSAVTELKRLSRELSLTVFIISSVNRANYLNPIDFESLKESGGIEYTCDVVWGLQLKCLNEDLFEQEKHIKEKRERVKEEKKATPRRIELCCLKNRYGIANFSVYFDYYSANDLFVPNWETDEKTPFESNENKVDLRTEKRRRRH